MKALSNKLKDKNLLFLYVLAIAVITLFIIFIYNYSHDLNGLQAGIFFDKGRDFFADYFNVAYYSKGLDPYHCEYNGFAEKAYFPITYFLFYYFSKFIDYSAIDNPFPTNSAQIITAVFIMSAFCMILFFALYELSHMTKFNRFLLLLCFLLSGIYIFSYERGNSVIIAAGCCAIFLATYASENKALREFGYLALALAAALKGYPALLGLLLLYRKEYKEAIRLAIYGLLFAFVPFCFLPGGFRENFSIFLNNVKLNSEIYSFIRNPKLGLYYYLSYGLGFTRTDQTEIEAMAKPAIYFISIAGLFLNGFQTSTWKKIGFIVCTILMIPANCGLYCGLYLFPVMVLFFEETDKKWYEIIYILLFAVILNPLKFYSNTLHLDISLLAVNLAITILYIMLLVEAILLAANKISQLLPPSKSIAD